MATALLPRDSRSSENRSVGEVHRLVVTWQHPVSRDISPVGLLTFDGQEYVFAYLEGAPDVEGFRALLGFPEFSARYVSDSLFPLFAQRAMDPRRPDFERYVTELGLTETTATPWEQISRSTGARGSDTLQLFPAPRFDAGTWVCDFLVHGVRYLLEKDVTFAGEVREKYRPDQLETVLADLSPRDLLLVEHEKTNKRSENALLVGSVDGRPVGWVPNWLAKEVMRLQADGRLSFSVEQVNPIEAGWHMRIVARMHADCGQDFEFFTGDGWRTLA